MALLTGASTIQVRSPLNERGLAWDQRLRAYRNRKLQVHESVRSTATQLLVTIWKAELFKTDALLRITLKGWNRNR